MPQKKTDKSEKKQISTKTKNPRIVKEKQELIIKVASELFSKKGYHRASLRDISAASGINLGYIYNYISSKDDILYLFYQIFQEKWSHLYENLSESKDENPIDQLKNLIESMLQIMHELNDFLLAMYTESRHLKKESLHSVLQEESKMIRQLEELIVRGVNQGFFETEDTFFSANIIQYLIHIYPLKRWNLKHRYSKEQFSELLINHIFSILKVK
jgi:TetR/AcrR family transcriptional regulator, cholesterol catabolism regulator